MCWEDIRNIFILRKWSEKKEAKQNIGFQKEGELNEVTTIPGKNIAPVHNSSSFITFSTCLICATAVLLAEI